MKKRTFLKVAGVSAAGVILSPLAACSSAEETKDETTDKKTTEPSGNIFTLPALGYAFDALAPHIDKETMEIHHGKHHAGYVRKLNKAVEGTPYAGKSLEEILPKLQDTAADTGVRNNGGGHYNHTLFWEVMKPNGGGTPTGEVSEGINTAFGDYETFKTEFKKAAKGVFGSGWAWLCKDANNSLFITHTPNQDNPLMSNLVEKVGTPLLGIDVWEHAYYLNYQNMRGDYIDAFFNVINWEAVNGRLKKA